MLVLIVSSTTVGLHLFLWENSICFPSPITLNLLWPSSESSGREIHAFPIDTVTPSSKPALLRSLSQFSLFAPNFSDEHTLEVCGEPSMQTPFVSMTPKVWTLSLDLEQFIKKFSWILMACKAPISSSHTLPHVSQCLHLGHPWSNPLVFGFPVAFSVTSALW